MKRTSLILFFFYSNLLTFSQVDTMQRVYDVKQCKLNFQFFNGPHKGSRIVIFDDWGNYESQIIRTEYDTILLKNRGISVDIIGGAIHNDLYIITPTYLYQINLDSKIGGKFKYTPQNNIDNLDTKKNKIGEEIYLGKKCEVFVLEDNMKIWLWKRVCLKKEFIDSNGEKIGEFCAEIDENYTPTKSNFNVPSDIVFEE